MLVFTMGLRDHARRHRQARSPERAFEKQGIGTYNVEEGRIVPDEIRDDLSLAVKVKGKGLAVISGCSHAGIINIIDWSREIAAEPRVDLAIGGFHLIEASTQRIRETALALKELDVGKVVTGHCTGLAALCEFSKVLGDRFEQLHVGTTIDLKPRGCLKAAPVPERLFQDERG